MIFLTERPRSNGHGILILVHCLVAFCNHAIITTNRNTARRCDARRQARSGHRKKWRSNQSTRETSSRHSCIAQAAKRTTQQAPKLRVNAVGVCAWNLGRVESKNGCVPYMSCLHGQWRTTSTDK